MKTRITTKSIGLRSRAALDQAVDQVSVLTTKIRILEAKRDKRLQAVREEHGAEITAAIEQRDALLTVAEAYVPEHRDEIFADGGKTASTALATFGLRLGQPTLRPINRRWTWAKILDAVKEAYGARFIRAKEELDKDAIKAQLGDNAGDLAKVGCTIEQTEAFWVEPRETAQAEEQLTTR